MCCSPLIVKAIKDLIVGQSESDMLFIALMVKQVNLIQPADVCFDYRGERNGMIECNPKSKSMQAC